MKKSTLIALALITLMSAGCGVQKNSGSPNNDETVNVGYVKSSKKQVSGSVGHVKNKENRVYNTIYDYFRDQVAGVIVDTSDPNDVRIYIRGISTIESPTDPLFIVDGVTVNDISHINPYEVESVDVLKDSEAAVYGVRGSNGVILITLKKSE